MQATCQCSGFVQPSLLTASRLCPFTGRSLLALERTQPACTSGRSCSATIAPLRLGLQHPSSRQSHLNTLVITKGVNTTLAASTATAAALADADVVPGLATTIVVASAIYTLLCLLPMILVPHASRKWLSSNLVFLPLAAAYLCLLIQSWTPDTLSIIMPGSLEAGLSSGFNPQFFPKLEGIAELFSRPSVAASWLLHVMVINLFAAKAVLLEGVRVGVPTAHSILLCALLGPLGWLSHQLTRALVWAVPSLRAREGPVQLTGDKGGTITLLPYSDS